MPAKIVGYKLTDKDGRTYGGCQWGEGVTNKALGEGNKLCSDGVIHFYRDPLLAVFANPAHGKYDEKTMKLWEFSCDEVVNEDSLKSGCKEGTTIKQIPLPKMTVGQRVKIALRCALLVYKEKAFVKWAESWLDGSNRDRAAARAAAGAAARDAAYAAAAAAYAAAYAAYAAADAAAGAAGAAYAAAGAAGAAYAAAGAAKIDVISIIQREADHAR